MKKPWLRRSLHFVPGANEKMFLKSLMDIKTEEKTFRAKKNFWTPLPEKTEQKTGKKHLKMISFRPKNV